MNDIINEAFLRANSVDAVRGYAMRSGHKREAEELERAHMMIIKLINYIEKKEKNEEES